MVLDAELPNQGHSEDLRAGELLVERAFGVGNLLADAEAGRWWEPGRPGAQAPVLEATLYSKVLPVNCVTKYLPDPRFWLTFSSQIWNNKNQ